jgi:hypothetical protein
MAAKIWGAPDEVGEPPNLIDFLKPGVNYQESGYDEAEDAFVKKVQAWAKLHGKGELAGEIWRYGVADGYAQYVVLKEKPLELIHLPIGDAWNIPDIVRRGLRLEDVKQYVERSKNPIFGSSRKGV